MLSIQAFLTTSPSQTRVLLLKNEEKVNLCFGRTSSACREACCAATTLNKQGSG